ncbi:MAG: glycosyltransferase family 4 protein [Bryobacteraceae bacterium]
MTGRKLLCLDQFASIGGGQRSLLDLLPDFSQCGWDVTVAIQGSGPFADLLHENGYRTYTLPSQSYSSTKKPPVEILKYLIALPYLTEAVQQIVEHEKAGLLYVNGPRLLPSAAWVARKVKIPLVFHCHNRLFQESAIILAGEALRITNAWTVASCRYAADPVRDYIWPQRLNVIYNGIECVAPNKPLRLADRFQIGLIGRVEKGKGQMEFVQAAKLVAQKFPRCRFRIVGSPLFSGSGYYRKVIAAAENTSVDFLEWQSDVSNIYSDLDLLVVPSSALEATPRVILEAFSAGIPVLAFPCGGIPEIIDNNRTGFLTAEATAKSLANRILEVLRMDRGRVASVVAQARSEWSRRFRLDAYREAVRHVLQQASNDFAC